MSGYQEAKPRRWYCSQCYQPIAEVDIQHVKRKFSMLGGKNLGGGMWSQVLKQVNYP